MVFCERKSSCLAVLWGALARYNMIALIQDKTNKFDRKRYVVEMKFHHISGRTQLKNQQKNKNLGDYLNLKRV